MTRVHVLLLPGVHALDFAGPVQALYEANGFGADYELAFVGASTRVRTAQGFWIDALQTLPLVRSTDWVVVAGTESAKLAQLEVPVDWLRQAQESGARLTSICSGAFALAQAGVLDGRRCTTHWKLVEQLRRQVPSADVLENRLYVSDGTVVTSAGEASGIDMSLSLIHEDHGARLAADVAREMVVYIRRSGESAQGSIYLDHRAHTHDGVHRVQDWIVAHPQERVSVGSMADIAAVSPRHLTRLFKESTGVTLLQFAHKVKLEVARRLAMQSSLAVEQIAQECGFEDARHLRRLWRQRFGRSIQQERRNKAGRHAAGHSQS